MGVAQLTKKDARVPTILTGSSRARRSAQVDLQFSKIEKDKSRFP